MFQMELMDFTRLAGYGRLVPFVVPVAPYRATGQIHKEYLVAFQPRRWLQVALWDFSSISMTALQTGCSARAVLHFREKLRFSSSVLILAL